MAEKLQRERSKLARKTGKKAAPVYLVIFSTGQHANLPIDPKRFGHGISDDGTIVYEQTSYLAILNTFLSKHELPHDKESAKDEKFLDQFNIKKNNFKHRAIGHFMQNKC